MITPYKRESEPIPMDRHFDHRCIGKIRITHTEMKTFQKHYDLLHTLGQIITVLRVTEDWIEGTLEYTCICKYFRIIKEGDQIPHYKCETKRITSEVDPIVKFQFLFEERTDYNEL